MTFYVLAYVSTMSRIISYKIFSTPFNAYLKATYKRRFQVCRAVFRKLFIGGNNEVFFEKNGKGIFNIVDIPFP